MPVACLLSKLAAVVVMVVKRVDLARGREVMMEFIIMKNCISFLSLPLSLSLAIVASESSGSSRVNL